MEKTVEVNRVPTELYNGVAIYKTHDNEGKPGDLVVLKKEGCGDLIVPVDVGSEIEQAKAKIDKILETVNS